VFKAVSVCDALTVNVPGITLMDPLKIPAIHETVCVAGINDPEIVTAPSETEHVPSTDIVLVLTVDNEAGSVIETTGGVVSIPLIVADKVYVTFPAVSTAR
jgi:hypothetical protein